MDVLDRIRKLRLNEGWTEYQLAERSGLTQSTISTWFRRGIVPTIPSLEKICAAFGISLAQFFTEEDATPVALTDRQCELVRRFGGLREKQQDILLELIANI